MQFENRPLSGLAAFFVRNLYRGLEADYTVCVVSRRPNLPEGYSLQEMSDDYAALIREAASQYGPITEMSISEPRFRP